MAVSPCPRTCSSRLSRHEVHTGGLRLLLASFLLSPVTRLLILLSCLLRVCTESRPSASSTCCQLQSARSLSPRPAPGLQPRQGVYADAHPSTRARPEASVRASAVQPEEEMQRTLLSSALALASCCARCASSSACMACSRSCRLRSDRRVRPTTASYGARCGHHATSEPCACSPLSGPLTGGSQAQSAAVPACTWRYRLCSSRISAW